MTQRPSERTKAMAYFLGSALLSRKHLPSSGWPEAGIWSLEWKARGQNTSLASVSTTLGVEAASRVTVSSYGVSYPETSAETQLLVGPLAPCCQPGTLEGLCHDGCASWELVSEGICGRTDWTPRGPAYRLGTSPQALDTQGMSWAEMPAWLGVNTQSKGKWPSWPGRVLCSYHLPISDLLARCSPLDHFQAASSFLWPCALDSVGHYEPWSGRRTIWVHPSFSPSSLCPYP